MCEAVIPLSEVDDKGRVTLLSHKVVPWQLVVVVNGQLKWGDVDRAACETCHAKYEADKAKAEGACRIIMPPDFRPV